MTRCSLTSLVKIILVVMAAFCLSALTILCFSLFQGEGYLNCSALSLVIAALYLLPLWSIAISLALGKKQALLTLIRRISHLLEFKKRSLFTCTFIMVAFWAIWLVALFPGSMNWDTFYQIYQCYPENHPVYGIPWAAANYYVPYYFSDHHPIFDTLIYGAFAIASDVLFGTWNWGVFLFVVLQSIATAFAFVFSIAYLERLNASKPIRLSIFAFFCIFPVYPIYAQTMLKDSLFSFVYVFFFLAIAHLVITKGQALSDRKYLVGLISCAILLSLTKKTGVYVVIGTMIILAIAYRKRVATILSPALASMLVMWLVMPYLVFPLLNVYPGGKQEMLAVPFQQTARYVHEHESEMEEWEREAVDRVLNMDTLADRYEPQWADPVKFMYNPEATLNDYINYAHAYIVEGMRHPEDYLEAWLMLISGYISPTHSIEVHEHTGSVDQNGSPLVWQPKQLDGIRSTFLDAYHLFSSIPLVNVAFLIVPYTLWIPVLCGFAIWKHKREWVLLMIPFAISLLSLMISPVVHGRYALPMIYTTPLLVGLAWCAVHCNASISSNSSRLTRKINREDKATQKVQRDNQKQSGSYLI